MLKRALALLSLSSLQMLPAWAAPPSLPPEIFTFEKITSTWRQDIGQKIKDMRGTYQIREVSPNEIEFRKSEGTRAATIRLTRSLSQDRSFRVETVLITDAQGNMLLEEKVTTQGTNLDHCRAEDKLFFKADQNGCSNWGLKPDETLKEATWSIGGTEVIKTLSTRLNSTDSNALMHEFYFGGQNVLTLRNSVTQSGDNSERIYEYRVGASSFRFDNPLSGKWRDAIGRITLKAVMTKRSGFATENAQYYADSREIFGLGEFLKLYDQKISEPMLDGQWAARGFIGDLLSYYFPKTQKSENMAANGRFLEDLAIIKNKVELGKTDKSHLLTATSMINEIIGSIQNGTIVVTDNRKRENTEK